MDWLLALVEAGIKVEPYILKLVEAFKNNATPTDAQLTELTAMEIDLDAQLQAASPDAA